MSNTVGRCLTLRQNKFALLEKCLTLSTVKKTTRQGKRAKDQTTITVPVPKRVKAELMRMADERYPGERGNLSRFVREILNEKIGPIEAASEIV